MITKFAYFLITENPDTLYTDDATYYINKDSIPFFAGVVDDEVVNVYVGDRGDNHGDNHADIKNIIHKDEIKAYPGRLWLSGKIMSFWVYPNEEDFRKIISELEKLLNIKIFKNGWQIEIVEKDGKIDRKNDLSDEYYYSIYMQEDYTDIISVDYYTGSNDVPEEIRMKHLMGWKEKERLKRSGEITVSGFGSTKTGFDQPRNLAYRQALYQERRNN